MHKHRSLFFKFAHGFRIDCNFTVLSRNVAQRISFVAYHLKELATWKLHHVPNALGPQSPSALGASACSLFYP
jgi:hypothetical protein